MTSVRTRPEPAMDTPGTDAPDAMPRHSIALVSRLTGLSQLVLRAWERRYGVVAPARTETGRRRYSDLDVERLRRLRQLTAAGHRIGDIASLPLEELRSLAAELPPAPAGAPTPRSTSATAPLAAVTAAALLDQALAAVVSLQPGALEQVLEQATVHLSRPALRQELIQPLMQRVGEMWCEGSLRIAHEHMASTIVQAFLAAANASRVPAAGSPLLVVAAPLRNRHELGAMMAASLALELGWEVLYLGADLPAEEIALAAGQRGARAVFLSLIYPPADAAVAAQLELLRRLLGPAAAILAGGGAAASYGRTLAGIGARLTTAPEVFAAALLDITN
jgi:MerR family transcriptional regulator, light-induced transcriptional regulator